MLVSRGAPYHLLVGGSWKHLASVAPGVSVAPDRPTSMFKSLGNVVWAQVADVVKRSWDFSFEWEDPEATRWLDYAASQPDAEVWLLDENLAQINMLPAAATQGGSSSTLVDVDGIGMRAFAVGESYVAKVRGGQTYHLSFTTNTADGFEVAQVQVDGASVRAFAPKGFGARRGSVTFSPVVDQDVTVVWSLAGATSGARLTSGSVDDIGFLPSRGKTPCEVLVGDTSATYKMAWADRQSLADSSYVLTELG